jgi:hypothetical protein
VIQKEVIMSKRLKGLILVMFLVLFTFSIVACGSSSDSDDSSDSIAYDGSTDPAVADSTNAATLAEYGMGVVQAGFPLVQPFVMELPSPVPNALNAQPLDLVAQTTVTVPVPDFAIIYGSDYGEAGTGTADLNGTLTLYLGSEDAEAATWYIIEGELDGSVVFDGFTTDGGPAISGEVTIPYGLFEFAEDNSRINIDTGEWLDDPGPPVWLEVEMTFANLTVDDGEYSWALGEGVWYLENNPGVSASLDIDTMAVQGEGNTYKLEDTNILVVPAGETGREIEIAGTGEIPNGTFYHPDLGVIYFQGTLIEEDEDGIVDGLLQFYDAVEEGSLVFTIQFEWDDDGSMTAYWLYFDDDSYDEFGYYDGSFTPDEAAMDNFPI